MRSLFVVRSSMRYCIIVFLALVATLLSLNALSVHAQEADDPFHPQWASLSSQRTIAVAWADFDGDGDLDLALGNIDAPVEVYRNVAGKLDDTPIWSSEEDNAAFDIAWGDIDNDGDPDLAVANNGRPSRVYANINGALGQRAIWEAEVSTSTTSLAWAEAHEVPACMVE